MVGVKIGARTADHLAGARALHFATPDCIEQHAAGENPIGIASAVRDDSSPITLPAALGLAVGAVSRTTLFEMSATRRSTECAVAFRITSVSNARANASPAARRLRITPIPLARAGGIARPADRRDATSAMQAEVGDRLLMAATAAGFCGRRSRSRPSALALWHLKNQAFRVRTRQWGRDRPGWEIGLQDEARWARRRRAFAQLRQS
jgi:hypothetical protein